MLTEKCKDYELSLQEYEARYDNEDPSLEGEVEILRAQTETQRQVKLKKHNTEAWLFLVWCRDEIQAMAKEYEHLEADLASLKNELSEEQKNKRKLEQVLREAALSIKKVLVVRIAQPPPSFSQLIYQ